MITDSKSVRFAVLWVDFLPHKLNDLYLLIEYFNGFFFFECPSFMHSLGDFLLQIMRRVLEQQKIQPYIRTKWQITDFTAFWLDQIVRNFALLHKGLKVSVCFQKSFFDEYVIFFRHFVLQDSHLAIERVTIFS